MYVQDHETASSHDIREVLENGEEVELSESETQPRAQTEELHTLDYCFFTDSATDFEIIEHRPRRQCQCIPGGCPHRPGQGCRRQCRVCGLLVGPGCCWLGDTVNRCHMCADVDPEPDPEPIAKRARVNSTSGAGSASSVESAFTLPFSFTGFVGPAFGIPDTSAYLGLLPAGPSLLVDTGAFRNIAGSHWISQKESTLKKAGQPPIKWHKLPQPHPVSGVGNDTVYAHWQAEVPVVLPGGGQTSYTCLYLEDNPCPALLGMKSLKETGTILDLRPGKMLMYSGNTTKIRIDCDKSNVVSKMHLEQGPGGHILLPCAQYAGKQQSS